MIPLRTSREIQLAFHFLRRIGEDALYLFRIGNGIQVFSIQVVALLPSLQR